MEKTQELQRFSTKDITPRYLELVRGIYEELRDNTAGPVEALSILTTIMVTINHTSGNGTTLEEFADAVRKNITNTKVVEVGAVH